MKTLTETYEFIKEAHDGVFDKGGVEYYLHPVAVEKLLTEMFDDVTIDMRHAALLHDVVEDTDYTLDDLREMGYNENILTMVALLTKKDGETYAEYLDRLINSKNIGAQKVKYADSFHNSLLERLDYLSEDTQEYLKKKYRKSKAKLMESITELEDAYEKV